MLVGSETVSTVCQAPLSFPAASLIISICCALGIVWALYNYKLVKKIHIEDME